MKEKLKWYNKRWTKAIILTAVICAVSLVCVYIWCSAIPIGPGANPYISATIKKDDNNWTCFITSPSRVDLRINYSTLVIKRGELTLVSLTIENKRAGDPINIDPLTNNITNYDIYALSKEGYTIYYYNIYKGSFFTGGDKFYIVNNGLRSGDVFEIRLYWEGYTCTSFRGSLP